MTTENVFSASKKEFGDVSCVKLLQPVVETNEEVEGTTFHENTTDERFVSVLEKRRMERKIEEEKECEWELSAKVEVEQMASKVDDLLSKLKCRFSEEKETRKRAAKQNRSHFLFCNSVDAFLRHVEKPRIEIKNTETKVEEQGEELYGFSVTPAVVRNCKSREVATPKKVKHTGTELETKETEEDNEKKIDTCTQDREQNLAHVIATINKPAMTIVNSQNTSSRETASPDNKLLVNTEDADDNGCHLISPVKMPMILPPAEILQKKADDICHNDHLMRNVFNITNPKPYRHGNNNPLYSLPYASIVRRRWPEIELSERLQNIHPTVKNYHAYKMTDFVIVPVFIGWKMNDFVRKIDKFCPVKHSIKKYNNIRGQSLFTKPSSSKVYGHPYSTLSDKPADGKAYGRSSLPIYGLFRLCNMSRACLVISRNDDMATLSTCKIPRRTYKNLFEKGEYFECLRPLENYANKRQKDDLPQSATPCFDGNLVTTTVSAAADDTDTTNKTITDECDDTSCFGILSVYCNSGIHDRYEKVLEDDR